MTVNEFEDLPEQKIELMDGRLSVGNGVGNLKLLRQVLLGWGAEAAVPMASEADWRQAVRLGFRYFDPPDPKKPLDVWRAWAAQLNYEPDRKPVGPWIEGTHRATRQNLMMSLFELAGEAHFAHVSGRDVMMRLGEDAHTPDVFAIGPRRAAGLNKHYQDGPADLVIEVMLVGHEAYDRVEKYRRYEAGGVNEYWLIDPKKKTSEFFTRVNDRYRVRTLDSDERIRSSAFPGLVFSPSLLWQQDSWGHGARPFVIEGELPRVNRGFSDEGVAWGDLPYAPGPGLEPRQISFEQFASWAPEAKFELIDGKPWIGGSRGSRNILGLLLRSEGLAKAVTVLHPREWIAALIQANAEEKTDAERKAHWWKQAHKMAKDLRDRFGFDKLVVYGDLISERPLNCWSMISLMAYEDTERHERGNASAFLYKKYRDEADYNLVEYRYAPRSDKEEADSIGVEI